MIVCLDIFALNARAGQYDGRNNSGYKSPVARARELFKPLKIWKLF